MRLYELSYNDCGILIEGRVMVAYYDYDKGDLIKVGNSLNMSEIEEKYRDCVIRYMYADKDTLVVEIDYEKEEEENENNGD